jgi:hypothetical protein
MFWTNTNRIMYCGWNSEGNFDYFHGKRIPQMINNQADKHIKGISLTGDAMSFGSATFTADV